MPHAHVLNEVKFQNTNIAYINLVLHALMDAGMLEKDFEKVERVLIRNQLWSFQKWDDADPKIGGIRIFGSSPCMFNIEKPTYAKQGAAFHVAMEAKKAYAEDMREADRVIVSRPFIKCVHELHRHALTERVEQVVNTFHKCLKCICVHKSDHALTFLINIIAALAMKHKYFAYNEMATAIFTSDNAAPLKTEVISICLHENAKVTKMDAADAVIFAASKCV